jgi:hypothetical protein
MKVASNTKIKQDSEYSRLRFEILKLVFIIISENKAIGLLLFINAISVARNNLGVAGGG